jgi:RNA polymerase sigma factor for flagellar operon FliA
MSRKRPATGPRARRESVPAPAQPAAPLPSSAPRQKTGRPAFDAPDAMELWRGYLASRGRKSAQDELDTWRNALIERHLPLVRFVAERLARALPRSVALEDLVSAGTFGLMDAIKGFDPERAVRFRTYAATRVRGAILDSLRSGDWVPRLVRLRAAEFERAFTRLSARHGREPTQLELAAELEIEPGDLAEELTRAHPRTQLRMADHVRESTSDPEHEPGLPDPRARTPLEQLIGRDSLRAMFQSLTPKERFIVEQYYEIGHTMRAIGEMLGLTESRVCQIHTNILARLRAQCASRLRERQG